MKNMLFKKDELRILWPFYLANFICGLASVIFPFMIIYFWNLGFSFFQIALLTSAFGISGFLFEVPTGAFADSFSRKYSTLLGLFITGITMSLVPFADNFYVLLLLWFLGGVGLTFISGAEESWTVDNLHYYKRKDLRQEYFIKNYSISSIGMIFAPLIGAFIVKSNSLSILWFVSGIGFLIGAFALALFAKEMYKPKRLGMIESLKKTWNNSKEGIRFSISHKTVFLLIIGSVFISLIQFSENSWQPFMVSLSMPQYVLGFVYSVVAIGWVVSPFIPKLFGKVNVRKAAIIVIAFRMLILFSILLIRPPFYLIAAAMLVFDQSFKAMSDPLLFNYIHKFIPTRIRATIISIKSMGIQIALALTGLIAGVLQDILGPQIVLALGGLFGVFAIATFLKIKD